MAIMSFVYCFKASYKECYENYCASLEVGYFFQSSASTYDVKLTKIHSLSSWMTILMIILSPPRVYRYYFITHSDTVYLKTFDNLQDTSLAK